MKFPTNVALHSQLYDNWTQFEVLIKLTEAKFSDLYGCYTTIRKGDIIDYPSVMELKENVIYRINNTVRYMYCYNGVCYELHRNTTKANGMHKFINELSDGEMPIYEIIEMYKL